MFNLEVTRTAKLFKRTFNGVEFINDFPDDFKIKMIVKIDSIFEFMKVLWWLQFPPKRPKRNWRVYMYGWRTICWDFLRDMKD